MTVKEFTDELIGEVTSPGCAMAYSAAEAKSLAKSYDRYPNYIPSAEYELEDLKLYGQQL